MNRDLVRKIEDKSRIRMMSDPHPLVHIVPAADRCHFEELVDGRRQTVGTKRRASALASLLCATGVLKSVDSMDSKCSFGNSSGFWRRLFGRFARSR